MVWIGRYLGITNGLLSIFVFGKIWVYDISFSMKTLSRSSMQGPQATSCWSTSKHWRFECWLDRSWTFTFRSRWIHWLQQECTKIIKKMVKTVFKSWHNAFNCILERVFIGSMSSVFVMANLIIILSANFITISLIVCSYEYQIIKITWLKWLQMEICLLNRICTFNTKTQ